MKELKKYSNKTKIAFIFLITMLIILLSNFNTLQNSKKTNNNINAIYHDRLVVTHYIFQYTNQLHFIKSNILLRKLNDTQKKNEITASIKKIQTIDKLYLETVLTSKEKVSFEKFLASCIAITKHSQNKNWQQAYYSCNQALHSLESLSQIQLEEGKLKLSNSITIHKGNIILGEMQIALMIILGGCALYLLMIKKNKINLKIPQSPSMN